jgi:hypothetical protein
LAIAVNTPQAVKPRSLAVILLALPLALAGGCAKHPLVTHLHKDVPPHGGTPVAMGDDFNLEFVLNPADGRLQAYVLDDEMEDFVRIAAPSFELDATVGGATRSVVLAAVPNPATGETVGSTSLFEGRADWLRGAASFAAVIPSLTIHDQSFSQVKFHFPEGTSGD